jgi:hypothetical protein
MNVMLLEATPTPYLQLPTICNNDMADARTFEVGETLMPRSTKFWNEVLLEILNNNMVVIWKFYLAFDLMV